MTALIILLIIGALAGPRTLAHTFAVAFDYLAQGLIWNKPIGVTLSSRAGLAARAGHPTAARIINTLFRDKNHCEDAIASDLDRARAVIELLTKNGVVND